jgi:ankyrin repeat protein
MSSTSTASGRDIANVDGPRWLEPRKPTDSSLKNETHWQAPEGSEERIPEFIVPHSGLQTRSTGHGRTRVVVPLHRDDRLGMASQKDDIVKVKKLLKKGIDPNVRNPESGVTPLGIAAERGHTEIMKALLAAKALVNVTTIDMLTPLHISCQLGKLEAARLLIDAKAEVNTLSAKHVPCGTTPLVAATIRNSLPTMRILIEAHADVNLAQDGSSGNALHLAAQLGHPTALKELLETGLADVTLRNGHREM